MERGNILRTAAIVSAVAVLGFSLIANRWHAAAPNAGAVAISPIPDDFSADLRRCGRLGPQDAEDLRCAAVWKENRERFFGRPARLLRPEAASANSLAGDAP